MRKSPSPIDAEIAARLRLRRKELGLSQEKLGDKLGVTFQQIQKYEKGVNRIGSGNLAIIASSLGVPVGYFFEGLDEVEGSPSPTPTTAKILALAGAIELLQAYSRIERPNLRKLVVDLARDLAEESKRGRVQPAQPRIARSGARPK